MTSIGHPILMLFFRNGKGILFSIINRRIPIIFTGLVFFSLFSLIFSIYELFIFEILGGSLSVLIYVIMHIIIFYIIYVVTVYSLHSWKINHNNYLDKKSKIDGYSCCVRRRYAYFFIFRANSSQIINVLKAFT